MYSYSDNKSMNQIKNGINKYNRIHYSSDYNKANSLTNKGKCCRTYAIKFVL